ncbi:hypothetical protein [Bilophila sp.]|uniref:hypothetical protein n=1 Tax=Bilophila sp. TaxID=1929485 RepID=UPI003077E114
MTTYTREYPFAERHPADDTRLPDLGIRIFLRYSKNHSRMEAAFGPMIRRFPGVPIPPPAGKASMLKAPKLMKRTSPASGWEV